MITLTSDSSGNTLYIGNNKSTGAYSNYIRMQSSDNTLHIFSSNDAFIESLGAVRLKSDNGQDITLTSADDIYMTFVDKLRINGHILTFTNGNVGYYDE